MAQTENLERLRRHVEEFGDSWHLNPPPTKLMMVLVEALAPKFTEPNEQGNCRHCGWSIGHDDTCPWVLARLLLGDKIDG